MKVSGIYKITNVETNECYVGSSKNIKQRWITHKCPSTWKYNPNKKLYIDFQQYGLDKFKFEIVEETTELTEREQYYIDLLKPSYNANRANGFDLERYKEYQKEYGQSEKNKKYHKKYRKKYNNQLCLYNSEELTLNALTKRFYRKGIEHPTAEAKKYLLNK